MLEQTGSLLELALQWWRSATLIDYAHVVLAVVVAGWFLSRYASE